MPEKARIEPRFPTIPQWARSRGFSPKTARRMIRELAIPLYSAGNSWPRVDAAEADAAIRRTRLPTTDHARARVEEIIDAENRAASP